MIAFDLIHAKTTFAISITCDCEFYKFKYKFHDFIIQNAPLFSERRVSAGVGWIAPLIASHYHHVLPIFHSGASSLARGACVILKIAFTKYLPSTRRKNETRSQIRVCWQFMHFDTMTFVVRLPSSLSEGV